MRVYMTDFKQAEMNDGQCFATAPVWKIVLLSAVTCGIYEVIWFYSLWKRLADKFDYKVLPLVRAIFAGITNFWLFPVLENHFKKLNQKSYSGILIAAIYLFLSLCSNLREPYWLIMPIGSTIIIALYQHRINQTNLAGFPNAPQNNWTVANTIWTVICAPLLILGIIGILMPAAGTLD